MYYDRKEFFRTEELQRLHPELVVREDKYDGSDYVVFSNPDKDIMSNKVPEWPVGLDLWVGHRHEKNVDGSIFDPLRCYLDRRGLTELLTGDVYGEIGTMTEVLTQHLYGGYIVDVMFGIWIKLPDSRHIFLVKSPYEVELMLKNDPAVAACVMIRILNDKRLCAINSTTNESCNILYHRIQYAADGFRRYEFLAYPLSGVAYSSRTRTISAEAYVHFYAAMYDSCIMQAHHDQSRNRQK